MTCVYFRENAGNHCSGSFQFDCGPGLAYVFVYLMYGVCLFLGEY